MGERLLKAKEASDRLGLDTATVYEKARRGEIATVKVGRRGIRFRESELSKWIEERSVNAENPISKT